jgi:ABC-2 type transport system ATP-binding protein
MAPAPVVEVKGLVKKYGDRIAVEGASFSINEGEIFGLLGPNGAGKSTTISILCTLLLPDRGEVTICNYDLRRETDRIKTLIGFVPQELALYPTLSAWDNLAFFGRIYGLRGRSLKERVASGLSLAGLSDRAKDAVQTFSGGMKRRLNIAASLNHQPRVLFLDEPTVGVDPQSRNFIFEHVERLRAEGMAILYTTHYMEEAGELSDRVGIMDHGVLIALGTQAELTKQVGEMETLILHISENDDPERLAGAIRTLKGVKKADVTDHTVTVIVPEAEEVLAPAVTKANELGIKIHSVDMREPNLEAVFLHLTGRALRD